MAKDLYNFGNDSVTPSISNLSWIILRIIYLDLLVKEK